LSKAKGMEISMYITKYWGEFIGGSDDSLSLIEFLEDLNKE